MSDQTSSHSVPVSDQSDCINELAKALSAAQGKIKPVVAGEEANTGTYKYSYATLVAHHEAARAPLAENGLSVVQVTRLNGNQNVLVTKLLHSSGQWIRSEIGLPPTPTPQTFGSMMSYYRRYAFSALIGTATKEEDDDGAQAETHARESHSQSAPPSVDISKQSRRVSEKQLNRLYAIARSGGWSRESVLCWMQEQFAKREPAELNWAEYDKLCNHLLENPSKTPEFDGTAAPEPESQLPPARTAEAGRSMTPIEMNMLRKAGKENGYDDVALAKVAEMTYGKVFKNWAQVPAEKHFDMIEYIKANPKAVAK